MSIKLTHGELRVLGCLIEKSLTTPDQYPLSINALTNACNQKSNREPVVSYEEMEVQGIIDSLNEKNFILRQAGATSRVAKYKHRFCNTEFSDLQFSLQQLAVVCVLMLRGPQTPGELRTRTNRMCNFINVVETEETLNELCHKHTPPIVQQLAREPGKRESRYMHCFAEVNNFSTESTQQESIGESNEKVDAYETQISQLQEHVELMQLEIDELRERLDKLDQ